MKVNKGVLVSGMNGFLGRNLEESLKQNNIEYTGFYGKKDCDLTNREHTITAFNYFKPETAVLMAGAVGGIGLNSEEPFDLMSKNLDINKNSIDACIKSGVKRIILIGTICSYPRIPKSIPFKEEDIYYGQSDYSNRPYGSAKLCMMEYLEAAKRQYGIDYTVLLLANMYGKYDDFTSSGNHIIPALIQRIKHAKDNNLKEVVCWGSGQCSRDFLYVEDACEAIIQTLINPNVPEIMNIGTGIEHSINFTAQTIAEVLDYTGKLSWDTSKPDGQPRRVLNIERAKKYLGWEPKVELFEGIKRTIDWYNHV